MSSEVIRRHTYAAPLRRSAPLIGVAAIHPVPSDSRANYVRIIRRGLETSESLEGYGALLTDLSSSRLSTVPISDVPVMCEAEHLDHVQQGDILRLDFERGYVRSLYRVNSPHNVIFATDRCNSNCLMCSQPPKDKDDSNVVSEHLRLVSLIPPTTRVLGITGGEPTLLG